MYKPPLNLRIATEVAWNQVARGLRYRDFEDARDGRLLLRGVALTTDIGSDDEAYLEWLDSTAFDLEMAAKCPRKEAA